MAKLSLPTDEAIHAKAAELGLLDDGNVPASQRSRIAKILATANVVDERPSTAHQLANFMADLNEVGITDPELVASLATEAVRVLIARGGLISNRTKE